ncbi:MAG TPA: CDP-alcohol phosphatidyltransferase family protein [Longimicrobiales bacterium]|nr:CDP-alcohol phosphatidyltransferase family protein [Longimicrobiales bacterium]
MKRHLPNLISALRFPMAVAFVLVHGTAPRLLLAAAAGLSDWVDGRLARATGTTSRTGEWLDPVADKTFMVVAVITLTLEAGLPFWVLPLLLLRDIGVVVGAGVLALLRRPAALPARRFGKWVTWFQFLAVALIVLRPSLALWIAPPVALLGAVALVDYRKAQLRVEPRRDTAAHAPEAGET